MKSAKHFRDLDVYQRAMSLVLGMFELTKQFPAEEKYALTDQVRRSSRSVCANLAEAWRKRRYMGSFVSKLIDGRESVRARRLSPIGPMGLIGLIGRDDLPAVVPEPWGECGKRKPKRPKHPRYPDTLPTYAAERDSS